MTVNRIDRKNFLTKLASAYYIQQILLWPIDDEKIGCLVSESANHLGQRNQQSSNALAG
jgi:hypothetical protein